MGRATRAEKKAIANPGMAIRIASEGVTSSPSSKNMSSCDSQVSESRTLLIPLWYGKSTLPRINAET